MRLTQLQLSAAIGLTVGSILIAMAFFLRPDLYLFSELSGVVTQNGQPVAGAKVVQSVRWKEQHIVHEFVTQADGRFHFEPVIRRSFFYTWIPNEPNISQMVKIEYQGTQYDAWYKSRGDYPNHYELKGFPMNFTCELTNPKEINTEYEFSGMCRIPGLPKRFSN